MLPKMGLFLARTFWWGFVSCAARACRGDGASPDSWRLGVGGSGLRCLCSRYSKGTCGWAFGRRTCKVPLQYTARGFHKA